MHNTTQAQPRARRVVAVLKCIGCLLGQCMVHLARNDTVTTLPSPASAHLCLWSGWRRCGGGFFRQFTLVSYHWFSLLPSEHRVCQNKQRHTRDSRPGDRLGAVRGDRAHALPYRLRRFHRKTSVRGGSIVRCTRSCHGAKLLPLEPLDSVISCVVIPSTMTHFLQPTVLQWRLNDWRIHTTRRTE
uniref:Putative secreted protein n=1 Tax=Anopheles darlingi TaxID=43151 RepID=A0A2M4DBM5_ANODA